MNKQKYEHSCKKLVNDGPNVVNTFYDVGYSNKLCKNYQLAMFAFCNIDTREWVKYI